MKLRLPESHPLDFDWRFTPETIKNLSELANTNGKVLAVGAPSVAENLEKDNQNVVLIDRQPIQRVKQHFLIDPDIAPPINDQFEFIITDPPWYPDKYYRWLSWAGQCANFNSCILSTLWPISTRPSAASEREEIIRWIKTWGSVELYNDILQYKTPLFELNSNKINYQIDKDNDWRKGDLLLIRPFTRPVLRDPIIKKEKWARFIINDYQLALRLQYDTRQPSIKHHPDAVGWIWPSVSLRASGRDSIYLWSSRNEVAIVEGSYEILKSIERMAHLGRSQGKRALNEPEFKVLLPLLEWEIPNIAFNRILQWSHLA